jgi:hypothetical protein
MALLYSIHDRDAHPLIPAGGWCVDAVLVTDTPPDYARIRPDINWIVRLNHGWFPNGTIPLRPDYPAYAKRCADFAARCTGVNIFIISNEPNHRQEYPNGTPIEPQDYADCFNLCYQAITYERPDAEILTAAVAPWDNTSGMDWLSYWRQMLDGVVECDGLAVHGYTHGADPNLIWSMEKQHNWYWHFPVIYQTIQAIPAKFADRPVHVTETDQGDDAWLDANTGWVQNAYESIDGHNQTPGTHKVCSLALYRWRGDKYEIHNKAGIQDDFRDAVRRRYESPTFEPGPTPPTPEPPRPTPPTPIPDPEPARDIDPRLIARGVHFDFAKVPAGTGYWRITKAEWLEDAAHQVGPDHHILGRLLKDNVETAGVPLRVDWPSGSAPVVSKRDDPNAVFNYDYAMGPSLNEYSIEVADGKPTDQAHGIGMGKGGNPREHTSTWISWSWEISEGVKPPDPIPPIKPPVKHDLVHPLPGAMITQHFGQSLEDYSRWGFYGHNGCDLSGVPEGSAIRAIADGVVAYVDVDPTGYGEYIRLRHEHLAAYSFYAHLQVRSPLRVGDTVKAGATIGQMGNTGNSTAAHLHIEIREANPDGSYSEFSPMSNGRVCPESWCSHHGLKL